MCGIAGQVTANGGLVDRGTVAAMGERLRHRGPDDHGTYVNGTIGLAHRRLSVLDLSAAGHQPMSNADGTVWVVLNGEIYNFRELRSRLRRHRIFRSNTDTEVLLYLYEDYGVDCVPMLGGMFAFAIWDEPRRRLVLARDRLGKKPLFYTVTDRELCFASELKALLVAGPTPDVDPVALNHYLTFDYVPTPLTIFRGIRKLRPGHVLVYEGGKATESAYWALDYDDKLSGVTDAECRERFLALFEDAVRQRLISDVPIGVLLSGGVDSSSVVAVMSRLVQQPVKTFSIGFKEHGFNELPYCREIAQQFNTDHHEFIQEPSSVELLPALVRVYDEPYADPSAIPTYQVAQLSRQFVTVVLNGDGGDELFAGYPHYQFSRYDRLADRYVPDAIRQQLLELVAHLPPLGGRRASLERLATPFSRVYLGRMGNFKPRQQALLYTPEFGASVREHDSYRLLAGWFRDAPATDLLDKLLSVDMRSYLPDDLLVKVDRATMAHGLEARCPLLDHRLAEFAASLPVHMKVRNGESKYVLKAAMRGTLPDRILDRPKHGFSVPVGRWFRTECRDFVRDILLSTRCATRGYFRPERVREIVEEHQAARRNYGTYLYALLMLELWHREYVDGAARRDHAWMPEEPARPAAQR